jgi:hypothetical protein
VINVIFIIITSSPLERNKNEKKKLCLTEEMISGSYTEWEKYILYVEKNGRAITIAGILAISMQIRTDQN